MKRKQQIRWWKMKKLEENDAYTIAVMHKTLSYVDNLDWQELKPDPCGNSKISVWGNTSKGTYKEKETWWWQEETRKAVALKRATFKQFQMNKSDENKQKFRDANGASRKAVRIAKGAAYEDLYAKLDSRERIKMVYKLANTRKRRSKDISDMPFINSLEGQILTVEIDIIQRWLTYFEGLLNTENTRKHIESGLATEGPIDIFNENEVSEQLGNMGLDKATGPDDLPIEAVKILAKQDIMYVVEAMNQVLQQGIPEIWRKSRMVPIYKGKGDILGCNNYRGIKFVCHSIKLWERLIEARLRQITSIDNTQYGFRPGKSTTEPIFILRIIQEKYREMNKELHMVFVDLENAYDRVTREFIWWCLRKKGVPEAYVTITQDMYNDCETLVSTRTGDTEYFHVGVGLHQGSALSPLLFILIMDVAYYRQRSERSHHG